MNTGAPNAVLFLVNEKVAKWNIHLLLDITQNCVTAMTKMAATFTK